MGDNMKVSWSDIKKLQKGTHFTSYVNKPLEDALVYILSRVDFITADHVTILADVLAFISAYLMILGNITYSILLMLIVTILDGVDGKLARLRGVPTKIGKLEHSFDFLYEQVWYASLIYASYLLTKDIRILLIGLLWLAIDGYVRHIYNLGWIVVKSPVKKWGKVGRIITTIDGRRNVYVWYSAICYFLLKRLSLAVILSFAHALFTAISYTILTYIKFNEIKKTSKTETK